MKPLQDRIPATVLALMEALRDAGGRPVLVGGVVRDTLFNLLHPEDAVPDNDDWDILCGRLTVPALVEVLTGAAFPGTQPQLVGQQFGVYDFPLRDRTRVQVSLPRTDNHFGAGHAELVATVDPHLTIPTDLIRRDYTMNAMAYDPFSGMLIDPFGGVQDLRDRVLRATSPAFSEDALRVLRGVQFASRMGLVMDTPTQLACARMLEKATTISPGRLWAEWAKWAGGRYPSMGLRILEQTGWILEYPELLNLIGFPQHPANHPEGCVWKHTAQVCDAGAALGHWVGLEKDAQVVVTLGTLLHDVGKPACVDADGQPTRNAAGAIISHGHDHLGVEPALAFLARIGAPHAVRDQVVPLVREHMRHMHHGRGPVSRRAIYNLATALGPATLEQWYIVTTSDASGRVPKPQGNPTADWIAAAQVERVTKTAPTGLLRGGTIMELLGLRPGPAVGAWVRVALEAQADGAFSTEEEAIQWLLHAHKEDPHGPIRSRANPLPAEGPGAPGGGIPNQGPVAG